MSYDYQKNKTAVFSDLLGKILTEVRVLHDEVYFVCSSGETFKLFHYQDCCESVSVEDVCGDVSDLIGIPILQAEENSNSDPIEGRPAFDSFTWTFYRIATQKGQVVFR